MSYLEFQEAEVPKNIKTRRWNVLNKASHMPVGRVSWYGPWRRYTFKSVFNIIFDERCMREISDFIEYETRRHKQTKTVDDE